MSKQMSNGKIKGFKKLTKEQQELFASTYAEHLASVENKESWQAVSVSWEGGYLKVTFKNGEWLHYTKSGSWY